MATLVVLVVAVAGGSYLWVYKQLGSTTTKDPEVLSAVGETLSDSVDPPEATDILVLGTDKRADEEEGVFSRSDTVILVHVDPDDGFLSVLSLPRDLRVSIPGHGMGKLNSAFSREGAPLTMRTVQELTNIDIDEYVEIDFKAFEDVTDALGGTYVDVDRWYYNDDPQFELINLQPGYQLLKGSDALDYVRFRHDQNADFGRMERQQRFLTAAREQVSGLDLALKLPGLISALADNVETTLTAMEMQKLALWAVRLDGGHIRQVSLTGDIASVDGESFVIPSDGAVEEAVEKLLTPPASGTTQAATPATIAASPTTTEPSVSNEKETPFITDPDKIENARLWGILADLAPFPVMAPGYVPKYYAYVGSRPWRDEGEPYQIDAGGDDKPAIKMVYQLINSNDDAIDQYMGVMETSWLDAPAASPGEKVEHNGVTFTVVGTNQAVDRIWWKQNDTLYWVSNTLSFYLSRDELLKVAQSMIEIPKSGADGQ